MDAKKIFAVIAVLLCSSSVMVIIEVFNENKSTITYMVDGIEYLSTDMINNTIMKHPEVPEKLGFYGEWDVDETKVTEDLTVNAVYTRYAYVVRFETDYPEFFNTYVYDNKNYKNPQDQDYGYSKDSRTGDNLLDGNGQLNFKLELNPYVDAVMEIDGDYNNIKTTKDDPEIRDGCYRLTKIASDITVKLIPKIKIVMSSPSGFYSDDFDLEMKSVGEIHYTLDSTTPTIDSPVYTGPIHIHDASLDDNNHSMRTDVSTGFDVGYYGPPEEKIDKCTTVRAICYYGNELTSDVESSSFFVDYDEKSGYDGCKIISIITDPDNLFDYETGIYVEGKYFDEYDIENEELRDIWWWWDANYRQRGDEWEREGTMLIFDSDGSLELTQNTGIRVRGGGSRGYYPRSLNIYARDSYGSNKIDIDLFGTGFNPQRITLFSGSDDWISKIKDKIVSEYTNDLNYSKLHFIQSALFLNGEFWGYYWITEKYDEEYFEYYYGVDDDNVIMIKSGLVEEGVAEDIRIFRKYESLALLDYTVEDNYSTFKSKVDIDSYIDYYAAEIYIARYSDWPLGNTALWRTRETDDLSSFSDAKWRFILYDVNSGGLSSDVSQMDSISYTRGSGDILFDSLMENNNFRTALYSKLLQLSELFNPESTDEYIENYRSQYISMVIKEDERFPLLTVDRITWFNSTLDDLKLFFQERYTYIRETIGQYCVS